MVRFPQVLINVKDVAKDKLDQSQVIKAAVAAAVPLEGAERDPGGADALRGDGAAGHFAFECVAVECDGSGSKLS